MTPAERALLLAVAKIVDGGTDRLGMRRLIAAVEAEAAPEKSCDTCAYLDVSAEDAPCTDCSQFCSNWQAANSEPEKRCETCRHWDGVANGNCCAPEICNWQPKPSDCPTCEGVVLGVGACPNCGGTDRGE